MEELRVFLERMPKVELHIHLESTMTGEMLERFAARHSRRLPRPAGRLTKRSAIGPLLVALFTNYRTVDLQKQPSL